MAPYSDKKNEVKIEKENYIYIYIDILESDREYQVPGMYFFCRFGGKTISQARTFWNSLCVFIVPHLVALWVIPKGKWNITASGAALGIQYDDAGTVPFACGGWGGVGRVGMGGHYV